MVLPPPPQEIISGDDSLDREEEEEEQLGSGAVRPPAIVAEYMSGGSLHNAIARKAEMVRDTLPRLMVALDAAKVREIFHCRLSTLSIHPLSCPSTKRPTQSAIAFSYHPLPSYCTILNCICQANRFYQPQIHSRVHPDCTICLPDRHPTKPC